MNANRRRPQSAVVPGVSGGRSGGYYLFEDTYGPSQPRELLYPRRATAGAPVAPTSAGGGGGRTRSRSHQPPLLPLPTSPTGTKRPLPLPRQPSQSRRGPPTTAAHVTTATTSTRRQPSPSLPHAPAGGASSADAIAFRHFTERRNSHPSTASTASAAVGGGLARPTPADVAAHHSRAEVRGEEVGSLLAGAGPIREEEVGKPQVTGFHPARCVKLPSRPASTGAAVAGKKAGGHYGKDGASTSLQFAPGRSRATVQYHPYQPDSDSSSIEGSASGGGGHRSSGSRNSRSSSRSSGAGARKSRRAGQESDDATDSAAAGIITEEEEEVVFLDFLHNQQERELCHCMAEFLSGLSRRSAARVVMALQQESDAHRLLQRYGGVYPDSCGTSGRDELIAQLRLQWADRVAKRPAVAATTDKLAVLESRRREWLAGAVSGRGGVARRGPHDRKLRATRSVSPASTAAVCSAQEGRAGSPAARTTTNVIGTAKTSPPSQPRPPARKGRRGVPETEPEGSWLARQHIGGTPGATTSCIGDEGCTNEAKEATMQPLLLCGGHALLNSYDSPMPATPLGTTAAVTAAAAATSSHPRRVLPISLDTTDTATPSSAAPAGSNSVMALSPGAAAGRAAYMAAHPGEPYPFTVPVIKHTAEAQQGNPFATVAATTTRETVEWEAPKPPAAHPPWPQLQASVGKEEDGDEDKDGKDESPYGSGIHSHEDVVLHSARNALEPVVELSGLRFDHDRVPGPSAVLPATMSIAGPEVEDTVRDSMYTAECGTTAVMGDSIRASIPVIAAAADGREEGGVEDVPVTWDFATSAATTITAPPPPPFQDTQRPNLSSAAGAGSTSSTSEDPQAEREQLLLRAGTPPAVEVHTAFVDSLMFDDEVDLTDAAAVAGDGDDNSEHECDKSDESDSDDRRDSSAKAADVPAMKLEFEVVRGGAAAEDAIEVSVGAIEEVEEIDDGGATDGGEEDMKLPWDV